jgi:hypothetical protein
MQMRASKDATIKEKMGSMDLRQQYKEELDMIIKMKQSELQKTKDSRFKEADQIAQSVLKCRELEEQHLRYKRERERMFMQESQVSNVRRKEEMAKQKVEEDMQALEQLRESLDLEAMNLRVKKEKHQKEIEQFQSHYKQSLRRKTEERDEERRLNKMYYEAEQKNLERLERENREFQANIIKRLDKNKDVLEFYERLYAAVNDQKRSEYHRTIEKPILECLQRELEKEKQDLLSRKQLKNENNKFILEQIENNSRKREMLQYEQAKMDYERLVEELERQDSMDKEAKLANKQKLMEVLNALKHQIEQKSSELNKTNCMNVHETKINDSQRNTESNPEFSEVGAAILGFTMPHERKRQLSVMEQSMKLNNHFLTNAMTLSNDNVKASSISRRPLFQPDASKSHLFNKENRNLQPSDFTNDYDYIRYRNKNATFDIISNSMRNF